MMSNVIVVDGRPTEPGLNLFLIRADREISSEEFRRKVAEMEVHLQYQKVGVLTTNQDVQTLQTNNLSLGQARLQWPRDAKQWGRFFDSQGNLHPSMAFVRGIGLSEDRKHIGYYQVLDQGIPTMGNMPGKPHITHIDKRTGQIVYEKDDQGNEWRADGPNAQLGGLPAVIAWVAVALIVSTAFAVTAYYVYQIANSELARNLSRALRDVAGAAPTVIAAGASVGIILIGAALLSSLAGPRSQLEDEE